MRITVIFDQPKWVNAKVGGFEYRYWQLRAFLADQGHNLTFIHLSYGSTAEAIQFEGLDVKTIYVGALPRTKLEKFKNNVIDLVNPNRALAHDAALNSLLRETNPDAVINLMASNPKLIRNLTQDSQPFCLRKKISPSAGTKLPLRRENGSDQVCRYAID